MTVAFATSSVAADLPRLELARRCREICLAHENAPVGAIQLEEQLALAVQAVRDAHGVGSISEEVIEHIFQREADRVSDARVLAELLAPRLRTSLETQSSPPLSKPAPAPPFPASSPPAAPADPPGIADLLDGMLDLDRHDARTRRPR